LEEIARRKQLLIERCARDRDEIAACLNRIRLPFNIGTLCLRLGQTLKGHPIMVAGISSLLVSGYGATLRRSAARLLKLLRLVQPLWSWWFTRRQRK
jgi:hypothetical protein